VSSPSSSLINIDISFTTVFSSAGGLALASAQQINAGEVNTGAAVNDHFGASLILPGNALTSGDIDKDGQDDLIIGTPERDSGTIANSGRVAIRYGIKVGKAVVTPSDATLPNNGRITYTLKWTHPNRWRDLNTIQLRLVNDSGVIAWIKWDESSNSISLGDPK